MKAAAVRKAKHRLEKAQTSLTELEKPPTTYADAETAWTDFLLALNSIYSCLEQGTKINPQSRQWFGRKKRERREDPLLRYLHQARNADEHGITPISRFQPPSAQVLDGTGNPDAIKSIKSYDDKIEIDYDDTGGNVPNILITTPAVFLVPVTDDRFGSTCEVPTEHLNHPLENNYPLTVARLGFSYIETLVHEAENLVQTE